MLPCLAAFCLADGAREPTAHDAAIDALCGDAATDTVPRSVLNASVISPSRVRVFLGSGADAAWVTDEEDTVLQYAGALPPGARSVDLDVGEMPTHVVPVAHFKHGCRRGRAAPSWLTQVMEFDYEGAGGLMAHDMTKEGTSHAAEPRAVLLSGGVGELRFEQRLFTPLAYARCGTGSGAVLAMRTFDKARWPATPTAWSATFDVPSDCLSLHGCIALPESSASCGGHPVWCVVSYLAPARAAELERAHPPVVSPPPRLGDSAAGDAPLHVLASRGQLRVSPGCAASTLYARAGAMDGPLVGYSHGAPSLSVRLARLPPGEATLHVFQLCERPGGPVLYATPVNATEALLAARSWRSSQPPPARPSAARAAPTTQPSPRHQAAQPTRDGAVAHRTHGDGGALRIAMLCGASFGTTLLVGLVLTSAVHWARRPRYRKLAPTVAHHQAEISMPGPRPPAERTLTV